MKRLGGMLGALLVAASGCSWIITEGPGANERPPVSCTTSKVGPGVDTVVAAVYGTAAVLYGAIYLMADDDNNDPEGTDFPVKTIAGVGALAATAIAVPFGMSASDGYARVRACKARKAAEWQPQPYPGQPYPGQPYPGQPYPGQPYPGQPYPGQPLYPQPVPQPYLPSPGAGPYAPTPPG